MKKILLVCIILMVLIGCKKQVVKVAPSINSVPSTSSISGTTATIGGSISADGGDPITSRGVVYGLSPNPTISDNKTSAGSGIGTFSSIISGLTPGQTYYFRTFATNSVGTSYGDQITFTSPAVLSSVTSIAATAITSTSATSGGNVTSDGGSPITARGVCWGTAANPTVALATKTNDGTGIGSFSSAITGLTPGVTYYARAYATNAIGTSYGDQITIAAPAVVATITTTAATLITTSTASSGGNITADGGAAVTARGVCWSTTSTPTTANSLTSNGTGSGSFTSSLTNLSLGTTYYIRAYATNSAGTVYGSAVSFTTLSSGIIFNPSKSYGSISDIDGNVYKTIVIGTQTWMAENLKTTKYRNGDLIGTTTTVSQDLTTENTPKYQWLYEGNQNNLLAYGRLYTWYVVTDSRALCPTGWHVPTDAEWTILVSYLGGEEVAGGKMKETGFTHWLDPNTGATNESGFTALAGGGRSPWGTYGEIPNYGTWWSSSPYSNTKAYARGIEYDASYVGWFEDMDNRYGNSVRCILGELILPTVTTSSISSITATSAISGGSVSSDGGSAITAKGICWSTTSSPTIANSTTNAGTGTGSFTSNLTGLSANTTYYVKAYATNGAGTAYGNQVTVTTIATIPTVTTTAISNITATTASSGGTVSSDGGATVTARGVCWATSSTPTISNNTTSNGTGTGSFTSTITGLVANTIYNVRAYATNSAGTAYGSEVTISTYTMAVVNTSIVTAITSTTATCGGTITSGLAMVTANGVCWSTSQNPTTANSKTTNSTGNASFTSSITGLTAGTTYYVRAYATNGGGTAYGTQVTFTTLQVSGSTITDNDGNVYNSVTIGTQVWMASNLKTTKYNDGTAIPLVTDGLVWVNLSTPAYCWYDNATANKNIYGALYNWYTVNTGKLCPTGWHVPSSAEWTTLTTYLGGTSVAGGKLKETGTSHWFTPNNGATNESGFTALPGGYHSDSGSFYYNVYNGLWWSSTGYSSMTAWGRRLYYNTIDVTSTSYSQQWGMSVRCLKD